jgi:AraC family transcriptional regulator, regulatory protein of adaptative response / methylated-DNA-[protein]-cysteine methyltransferase
MTAEPAMTRSARVTATGRSGALPANAGDDDARWHAVLERDRSVDDLFVYAVRTTGIYCRPSCSARRPRRENAAFFESSTLAQQAGYRSCKRCRPDVTEPDPMTAAITEACIRIQTADQEPGLTTLAREAGYSPAHFQRLFKTAVGLSPKQYAIAVRKSRLRDTLPDAASVTAAVYDAGYGSTSRAYEHRSTGMPLSTYRRGARGERIRYASAASSLGPVVIATTDLGICLIEFGDPDDLAAELTRRFPLASISPADEALSDLIDQVIALIDEPSLPCELPLDIRGTVFQERVWTALTGIRAGETVSYSELARRLGQPGAARAVARACATNTLAVAVPCHRVVSASGELAGYRWGIERKRLLLDRESVEPA